MVFAQARGPIRKLAANRAQHVQPRVQLDAMTLAVVESHGLDMGVAVQGPGQASGGVLAAGEKDQGASLMILHSGKAKRVRASRQCNAGGGVRKPA